MIIKRFGFLKKKIFIFTLFLSLINLTNGSESLEFFEKESNPNYNKKNQIKENQIKENEAYKDHMIKENIPGIMKGITREKAMHQKPVKIPNENQSGIVAQKKEKNISKEINNKKVSKVGIENLTGLNHNAFEKSKNSFIYSVAIIDAFFHNGVSKQGYGVLIKEGYIVTTSSLINEEHSFAKSIKVKVMDDNSGFLICDVSMMPKAVNDKYAILEPNEYLDNACFKRPQSFYHQRINVKYGQAIGGREVSRNEILVFPFLNENDTLSFKQIKASETKKYDVGFGLPVFSVKGEFMGFLSNLDKKIVLSKNELKSFICDLSNKNVLSKNEITAGCL